MVHAISSLGFSLVLSSVLTILFPMRRQDVQRRPASDICSYMPLSIGNSWTYSSRGGAGENRSVFYGYERQITDVVRDAEGSILPSRTTIVGTAVPDRLTDIMHALAEQSATPLRLLTVNGRENRAPRFPYSAHHLELATLGDSFTTARQSRIIPSRRSAL